MRLGKRNDGATEEIREVTREAKAIFGARALLEWAGLRGYPLSCTGGLIVLKSVTGIVLRGIRMAIDSCGIGRRRFVGCSDLDLLRSWRLALSSHGACHHNAEKYYEAEKHEN